MSNDAKLPLKKRIDTLARLTERSRSYFDIYKFIEGADTRPHIIDEMNDYASFFQLHSHVYRFALFSELDILFSLNRKHLNFRTIIKESKSEISDPCYEQLNVLLKESELTASKVKILRNKAFAHRDPVIDFNVAFKEAQITLNEIEQLIAYAKEIAGILCSEFSVASPHFRTDYINSDCKQLFRKLGSEI